MDSEFHPDIPKTDEESFEEIRGLLREGWKFGGNVFERDQTYRLVMSKEGEEDMVFHTMKAYPESFDSVGRARTIP